MDGIEGSTAFVHDRAEVEYDGQVYSVRESRQINHSPVAVASYEVEVYAGHGSPLAADQLGLRAWCLREDRREEMSCVPVRQRDAQITFVLSFPEGRELRPGQSATIQCRYAVSDRQWGQRYERQVQADTHWLSVAARLPTDLEPECWGMTRLPSRTGLEPLSHVVAERAGDRTVHSWDGPAGADGMQPGRRVRLDWFFWRRILDSRGAMAASEVMAQFGIVQIRDPARGRRLPGHVLGGGAIRSIDLGSAGQRALARRILDHLIRVAGWVVRYHTFKPGVGMGIAAPQLGIAYRIAIVREPHSGQYVELINPRVVGQSAQLADGYEGCLSFFDVRGIVRRPASLTVAYDRLDGEPARTRFTGTMAVNVQHELDHLNGKLYTDQDRMPPGMDPTPVKAHRATG